MTPYHVEQSQDDTRLGGNEQDTPIFNELFVGSGITESALSLVNFSPRQERQQIRPFRPVQDFFFPSRKSISSWSFSIASRTEAASGIVP